MAKEVDFGALKKDFPILFAKMPNGKPLVYLDSAATSQKPRKVINTISKVYRKYNANPHRGAYWIAEKATEEYDRSKVRVARLINASSIEEVVYTRNTTESINLVAQTWGDANIGKGDHILISEMEHHSNIVPWLMLAHRKGAVLDYIKLDDSMTVLDEASLDEQLEKRPKLVAITHCSNVLGTIVDVKQIARKAHQKGAKVLVDGAQSAPHMPIDVKDIDLDFFAFSAHKMLGPSGVGVLYAKRDVLESMPPFLGGGHMIRTVAFDGFTSNELPWKFEAGTANIEGAIGFGAAIDYLKRIGMARIREHEKQLTKYALERISEIGGVSTFGLPADRLEHRAGVISFEIRGVHPHDVATIFDSEGVAIRAGHHCAMPLVVNKLKMPGLARMSFYIYNDEHDIDVAMAAIKATKRKFKVS